MDLFPISVSAADIPAIPGLSYLSEYLSTSEEQRLVEAIDAQPWDTSWQRRRQPYGSNYGSQEPARPIPAWGRQFAERLLSDKVTAEPFDQMLVNEYAPGQGIALHRDYEPFGRTVCSLSLLSPCVMDFRQVESGRTERL